VSEYSFNDALGLDGELACKVEDLSSNIGVLAVLPDTVAVREDAFDDERLAAFDALRGLSLATLALRFGAGLGAVFLLEACFGPLSVWISRAGDVASVMISAGFDDEPLAKVGVGNGCRSVAVDGRLLELPSREDPGRWNGSSRRGGIIEVISMFVWDSSEKGAVDGLWRNSTSGEKNLLDPVRASLESVLAIGMAGSDWIDEVLCSSWNGIDERGLRGSIRRNFTSNAPMFWSTGSE
jgi:hypothetical protein